MKKNVQWELTESVVFRDATVVLIPKIVTKQPVNVCASLASLVIIAKPAAQSSAPLDTNVWRFVTVDRVSPVIRSMELATAQLERQETSVQ